jgi:hypothetical protein
VVAIRRYYDRNGHYPERILVDKIYRNRKNIQYCKARGIRIFGPSLGRPKKDEVPVKTEDYRDNANRVEVERGFSHLKGSFGLGLFRIKRQDTTMTAIVLSILLKNLSTLSIAFLRDFLLKIQFIVKHQFELPELFILKI